MVIPRYATEPVKTSNILCQRLGSTPLGMILKHIPTAGRTHIGIRTDMRNHLLDPVRRQLDIVVQKPNIVSAYLAQTRIHRADNADSLGLNFSHRKLILKAAYNFIVRIIIRANSHEYLRGT